MLFKFDCKRFGGVVLIALLALLMSGCQSDGAPAPVANIGERGKTHSVQKGDTLYSIAWRYGLDHGQLAKINRIRKPYTIYAGQRLKLAGVPRGCPLSPRGHPPSKPRRQALGPKPSIPRSLFRSQNRLLPQVSWPGTGLLVAK